jgi:hypothetical protein
MTEKRKMSKNMFTLEREAFPVKTALSDPSSFWSFQPLTSYTLDIGHSSIRRILELLMSIITYFQVLFSKHGPFGCFGLCSEIVFSKYLFLILGYLRLLREGRAPIASPDPLSVTSDESYNTPDLEML